MPITNDPVDQNDFAPDDWTPASGLRAALIRGGIVAGILAALLVPMSLYLPYMTIPWLLRAPLGLGIAWILFRVVQDAAGMAGWPCSALALALTFAVLTSQHAAFAAHGVPELVTIDWWAFPASILRKLIPVQGGVMLGLEWFHIYVILALNAAPMAVVGVFAVLWWGD